jgi:acyl-coenzyme A thioesterase 13
VPGAGSSFEPLPDPGAFLEHIGPVLSDGEAIALRIDGRHLNAAGMAQGGVLATLVDFAMGRAIRASTDEGRRAATVSLTTDFLGAAREGDLIEARTEVERLGGTLAFADCSLTVDGREIVRGRAVFAVLSADHG